MAVESQRERRQLPLWAESIILVLTALLVATVIKALFVQAFFIPSGSMEPTLQLNDKVLVEKVSYWGNGTPQRGDIVVFDDSGHWLSAEEAQGATGPIQKALEFVGLFPSGGHLIKRVIGVGGDTVSCCDLKGRIQVNGVSIDEPYVSSVEGNERYGSWTVTVPQGDLWVMGDNRANSADSRAHLGDPGGGFVPVKDVVGKAWLLMWPANRFGTFEQTTAFDKVPGAR